ncbi:MAG: hypothetical protein AUJ56_02315 [Zetaproteobacteria bacterium CG1_02_49_23]|nr:MAG: hypothetical protein AUJ56_02315 [Zetaproteobacteria bacterium CG1_02_49_23]
MKIRSILMATALMLGSTTAAQASDLALGGKIGTLGLGGEITTNVVPMLVNARLQLNGFNYSQTVTDTTVTYDGKLKLFSVGALADVYPFAGKFRVSGGAYYTDNKLDIVGKPTATGNFNINGTNYTTAQLGTLNGKVTFSKFAPYLGIGWGDAISSGSPIGFNFELGALYQGSPKTSLSTTKTVAGLSADIAAEKKKMDDALNNMKLWPVVSAGISWRF